MALTTCPECNKEVSSAALACPHCAHPLKAPKPSTARLVLNGIGLFVGLIIMAVVLVTVFGKGTPRTEVPAPAAVFEVTDSQMDTTCSSVTDYCMNVYCTVRNRGNAAGSKRVMMRVGTANRGNIANYYKDTRLEPGAEGRVEFRVPEVEVADSGVTYECSVDNSK